MTQPIETKQPQEEGLIIKSPIVGTFYRAPNEGSKPFVELNDEVSETDVVCIIEAMKMNNEIISPYSGKIIEIFVLDGEAVEFDQPLMRIQQ